MGGSVFDGLMGRTRSLVRGAAVLAIAYVAAGCASFGGGKGDATVVQREDGQYEVVGQQEYEARLRGAVESELEREHRRQGEASADLVNQRPYYYKEYYTFPNPADIYSLDFTETESRTTPLTAELEVEKTRYATRFYRKRDEARADDAFLRNQGIERVSYELRNGRWRRTGSLFVAQNTERFVDGTWQQIEEASSPALSDEAPEQKRGWLRRLMFWR